MRNWRASLVLLAGVFLPAALLKADKPCLRVDLQLQDVRFGQILAPAALGQLRDKARGTLIEALNRYVRFIHFTDSEECANGELQFVVKRRDTVPGAAGPERVTQIEITLHASNLVRAPEVVIWPLYPNIFEAHIDGDTTLTDLGLAFRCPGEKITCPSYTQLVESQLSKVAVGEGGEFVREPLLVGWRTPLREDELCVGLDSVLEIESELHVNTRTAERFYDARVLQQSQSDENGGVLECKAADPLANDLAQAQTVVVKRIFVKEPQFSTLCTFLPADSGESQPGGTP